MGESWKAWRLADPNWALLSVEQKASADGIRRELRKTLSLPVPEIQDAPLLDKRDLERFAKLSRTIDAALGLSRFAVTKSATSLPTGCERRARKLGNCSNLCREKARGNRQLPSEVFSRSRADRPGGHQAVETLKV